MNNSFNKIPAYARVRAGISVLVLALMTAISVYSWDGHGDTGNKAGQSVAEYGEYMEWGEVAKLFPRYGNAEVVDLDTGLRFSVQRRGGTYHADVQPLTAGDTGVMKQIYGGRWSWKRRAVLVLAGGRQIAGSMNGMPHGGGHIRGNDFPGHFCIHFRGSRLHINGREDLAHGMMVFKAAGMLEEMMQKSTAGEVVKIFFTALDQGEMGIAVRSAYFHGLADVPDLFKKSGEIGSIKVRRITPADGGSQDVSVDVVFKNNSKSYSKRKAVDTVYHRGTGWRIDYSTAAPLLTAGDGDSAGIFKPDEGEDFEEE